MLNSLILCRNQAAAVNKMWSDVQNPEQIPIFLFHVFCIEVEMLLQVCTTLFEVPVMRLHTGSISYSDAEVVVFVYDLQTFKFCKFRDFFWVIFLFQNEHLGLIFVEDQTEFLEHLLSSCNELVEMLLFEDKNNIICIGFLVDFWNIRESWN